MAAPATVDDFLELVRKSNQIDAEQLDAWLRKPRTTPLPTQPRKLAWQMIREGVLTLFQAEQFLLGKYKGFHLGGYRILERLGSGGAGTVYLGEHEVMKRRVALKVLPTPAAEDPASLERFRREARAAAVLDHPNVVRVFDLRHDAGLHFIVMEYIDGPNLQQVIGRSGRLHYPVACEYIRQAASGLHHAHQAGLVHRDIKPANLLVDSTGTVKILDLGLARYDPEGADSLTQKFNNKMVLGTADYLAPEQALNLHEVDHRADIYSLGATLYALLAGQPPFHEGTVGQKLLWHQTQAPPPLKAYNPEVPDELVAVVNKMLAKRPEDRWDSAEDIAAALSPWADLASRTVLKAPSASLFDIRMETGSRTGPLFSRTSASGRMLATPSTMPDTRVNMTATADTATLERKKAEVVPAAEAPPSESGSCVRLAPKPRTTPQAHSTPPEGKSVSGRLIAVAAAVICGLAAGVGAFLLWGPRG